MTSLSTLKWLCRHNKIIIETIETWRSSRLALMLTFNMFLYHEWTPNTRESFSHLYADALKKPTNHIKWCSYHYYCKTNSKLLQITGLVNRPFTMACPFNYVIILTTMHQIITSVTCRSQLLWNSKSHHRKSPMSCLAL